MDNKLKKVLATIIAASMLTASMAVPAMAAGVTVDGVNKAGNVITGVKVTKGDAATTNGKAVVALYDAQNNMKSVAISTEDLNTDDDGVLSLGDGLTFAEGDIIKTFLWEVDANGSITAKPITGIYQGDATVDPEIETYSVSGTVTAGVISVTLVNAEDATKTVAGTITDGAISFGEVAEGTYNFDIKYGGAYEKGSITIGGAEVTNLDLTADVTDLAITAAKIQLEDPSYTANEAEDSITVNVVADTYFDKNAENAGTSYATAAELMLGYNKISGGNTIGFGNEDWGVNRFALMRLIAPEIKGDIYKAELNLTAYGADRAHTVVVGSTSNVAWKSDITYNTLPDGVMNGFTQIASGGISAGVETALKLDITDYVKSNTDGIYSLALLDTAAGGMKVYASETADKAPSVKVTMGQQVAITAEQAKTDGKDATLTIKGTSAGGIAVDTTVTLTKGEGSILLPIGTYKYSMEATQDYLAVAETEFTVAKGGSSVPVTLEVNDAEEATVTIKYVCDGVEIADAKTITGKFVGGSLELSEITYDATIKKTNDKLIDVYTYVSGAEAIEELVAVNTVEIVYNKKGSYDIYEDFSAETGTWGFTTTSGKASIVVSNGELGLTQYNKSGYTDSKTFDTAISSAKKVNVSFDWKSNIESTKNRKHSFDVTDSSGNVIFSLYASATDGVFYTTGTTAGTDGGAVATATKIRDAWPSGNTSGWYNVDLTYRNINDKGYVAGTITAEDGTEFVIDETQVAATNFAMFKANDLYSLVPQVIDNVGIKVMELTADDNVLPSSATITAADDVAADYKPYGGEVAIKELGDFTVANGKVTGTANYIENWTAFSSDTALQSGYFTALAIQAVEGATVTITKGDETKTHTAAGEGVMSIVRLDDDKTVTYTVDNDGDGTAYKAKTYTIDLSEIVKKPRDTKATIAAAADVAAGYKPYGGDVAVEEFGDYKITADAEDATKLTVTGKANYKTWTAYSSDPATQEGHYVPLAITAPVGAIVTITSGEETKDFTAAGSGVMAVRRITDSKATPVTITIDTDGEGTEFAPVTYTLDMSAVVLGQLDTAIEIKALAADTELYGKKVSELGEVAIADGKMTGTANYIEGWTKYNDADVAEQEGNYVTMRFEVPELADYSKATITTEYGDKTVTYNKFSAEDKVFDLVVRIQNGDGTLEYTVDFDGEGTKYNTVSGTIDMTAVVKQTKSYAITKAAMTGGTVEVAESARVGEKVSVTVTPDTENNYSVENVYYTVEGDDVQYPITADDKGEYSFTMPAGKVTVNASFTAATVYTITDATADENGNTITVATGSVAGKDIAVTVNAAEHYELDKLTVMNGETPVEVTADNKFKMPEANVTVTATFKLKTYTVTFDVNGTKTTADVTALASVTELPATPAVEGKYFAGWKIGDAADVVDAAAVKAAAITGATTITAVYNDKVDSTGVAFAINSTGNALDKNFADLGSFEIKADAEDATKLTVTGASNYVAWPEFSSLEGEGEGNYIVTKLTLPETVTDTSKVTVKYKGSKEKDYTFAEGVSSEDFAFIIKEGVKEFTFEVDYDGEGEVYNPVTYTVDISKVAKFNLVANYDFEDGNVVFEDTSPDGSRMAEEVIDDATLGSKVVKLTNSNRNNRPSELIDFSSGVVGSVVTKVSFDVYFGGGSRAYVTLGDIAKRGRDAGGSTSSSKGQSYGTTGAIFNMTKSNGTDWKINGGSAHADIDKWVHVETTTDYATRKITYTVTNLDGTVIESKTVDYVNNDGNYINCIDVFQHNANNSVMFDNINIQTIKGTANTVTINYVDAEGKAIKEAKTDATAVNTLSYTVAEAEKAPFEVEVEGTKYRYTYNAEKSTASIASVSDDAKTITLVFDKAAYETTTFNVTLPAAAATEMVVPVIITGAPTDTTAAAVSTTINATVAAEGTTGTATIDLLPGAYTYAIELAPEYMGVEATAITVGEANAIVLAANVQTLAAMDINARISTNILTTALASKAVGKVSTTQYADAEKTEELATYEAVTYTVTKDGAPTDAATVAADGTVSITSAATAGTYTITAAGAETTTVTATAEFTVAETGTETVAVATDNLDGTSTIFAMSGSSIGDYNGTKVMKLGAAGAESTTVKAAFAPVVAETGKVVNISWTSYSGWHSNGKEIVWTLKNSAGENVVSFTYSTGGCAVKSVTVAGVAHEANFGFQPTGKNQNGWSSFTTSTTPNTVSVTLNADKSVTVVFKQSGTTVQTFTVAAENSTLTVADVVSFEVTNNCTDGDRSGGFDNFQTTVAPVAGE